MVWCLTPKRTQDVYEKIFNVLKKKSIEYGTKFEPRCAYLDFEIGTINALEKAVSNLFEINKIAWGHWDLFFVLFLVFGHFYSWLLVPFHPKYL
jgi:hypothetical protein